MGWVWLNYSAEALPLATILYALTWQVLRRHRDGTLQLSWPWHLLGVVVVAFGAGIARIASALIISGRTMQALWSSQGIGLIGPVIIPIILSAGVLAVLWPLARRKSPVDDVHTVL
jgi:hypothetical protein